MYKVYNADKELLISVGTLREAITQLRIFLIKKLSRGFFVVTPNGVALDREVVKSYLYYGVNEENVHV